MADQSVLCGEIDLPLAAAFRDRLYESIDLADSPIVRIDLSAVTFIDSTGFHALADATEYARRRGRVMQIRNLAPFYAEVMRLCDLDNELLLES